MALTIRAPKRKSTGRRLDKRLSRFDAKIRKHSRELGSDIVIEGDMLSCSDTELNGLMFYEELGPPSNHESALRRLHERVYHRRGQAKLAMQGFKCALCAGYLSGTNNTSIDHIDSRGAHGRNDRMVNLRVVHENPCHRQRHGDRVA